MTMRLGTPGLKIGIFPSAAFEERRAFFDILGAALNLTFEGRDSRDYDNLTGLFLFSDSQSDLETCRESGLSVLQFRISGPPQSVPTKTVKFATSDAIHASFRGQTLNDESLTTFCPLRLERETLAWIEGFPVWTREQVGTQSLHTVGIDLPPCGPDGFFYQFFQYTSWFRVVPLLTFLKDSLPVSCWLEAEARASIIVDDPNLHRTDYGFIDYRNLVRHADQHNYHVSIAAIPLDMWYTNRAAAAILRNNPERISLIFHGIDHTLYELGQECSDETAFAILTAGLKRVERFERKSGLSVERVMTAPHGAFAEHFARAMTLLTFEGACVSLPSLLNWNAQRHWPADTGLSFAQAVGSLPVFHRFGPAAIPLYSFLGHPVIVISHHQDCVGNYSQFEKWASTINGISKTRWCSVGEIARSNYYTQRSHNKLLIFLYSRYCSLDLPPGTTSLEFKSTPFCAKDVAVSLEMLKGKWEPQAIGDLALNWDRGSNRLSVRVVSSPLPSSQKIDVPPIPWWPYLRRFITEARDRALPLVPSWIQRKS
jgi:hypothetical protein